MASGGPSNRPFESMGLPAGDPGARFEPPHRLTEMSVRALRSEALRDLPSGLHECRARG